MRLCESLSFVGRLRRGAPASSGGFVEVEQVSRPELLRQRLAEQQRAEQQGAEPARQGLETEPESNPELDELRRRLEGLL